MAPQVIGFTTIDFTMRQEGRGGLSLVTEADKKVRVTFHQVKSDDNLLSFLRKCGSNLGPEEWLVDLDANDPKELSIHFLALQMKWGMDNLFLKPSHAGPHVGFLDGTDELPSVN